MYTLPLSLAEPYLMVMPTVEVRKFTPGMAKDHLAELEITGSIAATPS